VDIIGIKIAPGNQESKFNKVGAILSEPNKTYRGDSCQFLVSGTLTLFLRIVGL